MRGTDSKGIHQTLPTPKVKIYELAKEVGLTSKDLITFFNERLPGRVEATLNFRYAPNRSPEEAEAQLRALVPETGQLRVIGNAPPSRAAVDNPLIDALRKLGNLPVEPKQAWTPVAEFSAEGLDAVNFGPGASRFAHQQDEQVHLPDVVRAFEILQR